MRENIMFIPAVILMVVETIALGFLIWSWFDAKRKTGVKNKTPMYIWIKYAHHEPTAENHSFGDIPDDWVGVYLGVSASAPTDWTQYTWNKIKGKK